MGISKLDTIRAVVRTGLEAFAAEFRARHEAEVHRKMPMFTYPEIVNIVRRIDVLWFNDTGFKFPKCAFEVVHSLGTL